MNNSDTHVILPPGALHGCVRAFIARDTTPRQGQGLTARPGLNHFPASPFCAITWFVAGRTYIGDSDAGRQLERVVVSGPLSRPLVTWNPGPVHAFMVVFYPQAFQQMTGLALAAMTDRLAPLRGTLAPAWEGFADAILAAAGDGERLRLAECFLRERWQPAQGAAGRGMPWLRALRDGLDGFQRTVGERQFERKIKQLTGQSMQALRRVDRLEAALLQARDAAGAGLLDWSRLAAEAGYADQPHLCREVRRLAGAAPGELLRRSNEDDGYWLYRCWR